MQLGVGLIDEILDILIRAVIDEHMESVVRYAAIIALKTR